jgi:hypothetical protein
LIIERDKWYQALDPVWNRKVRFTITKSDLLYIVKEGPIKARPEAIRLNSFKLGDLNVVSFKGLGFTFELEEVQPL